MSKTFFPGGIHLSDSKDRTKDLPIELFQDPDMVVIPLSQHLGKPAMSVVKVGDRVKIGQLIGEAQGDYSANVHASISGEVVKIGADYHPVLLEGEAIVIKNDHLSEWFQPPQPRKDNPLFTKDELLQMIRQAGIVGLGGATFPTHIKLNPKDKPVDTLIINGAECEPFLTCDYRLMMEQADSLFRGLQILIKILPVKKIIIGIEENKKEAIRHLSSLLKDNTFDIPVMVESLKEKYPQGAEKNLIYALIRRVVPVGKLPFDIGVVVQNIGTVIAIHEAVNLQKPLIDRVITISGEGISKPRNLRVKIGTLAKDLIAYCEGDTDHFNKVIFGGPMMGISVRSLEVPVIKGTSGVLLFPADKGIKENQCIRCGACIQNCPAGLMPIKISEAVKIEEVDRYNALHTSSCVECGVCSYNCPARIPLLNYIRTAKAEILKRRTVR